VVASGDEKAETKSIVYARKRLDRPAVPVEFLGVPNYVEPMIDAFVIVWRLVESKFRDKHINSRPHHGLDVSCMIVMRMGHQTKSDAPRFKIKGLLHTVPVKASF
jgi:hypothetical protein